MDNKLRSSIIWGLVSAALLISVYFAVVGMISGLAFALEQFKMYWYFLLALTAGFGIQIGIYRFLKLSVEGGVSKGMVATSGTTSTLAMISCCSHYLVNLLPILGVAGIATIISQYQVELFWVGLLINMIGIYLMINRLLKYRKAMHA